MEGSTYSKEVKNYELLAQYYDELLIGDSSYEPWLKYINAQEYQTVLELASGSAVLAKLLKKQGKDVVASDLSEKMMEVALKNGFDGEYQIINMVDYKLERHFDLVLCILDSINYLEEDELYSFFKAAYNHLNKGGRFIFYLHSLKRLNEFKDEYVEEGNLLDGTAYQWTILSDTYEKTLLENFVFYTSDGIVLERHQQKVFEPELLIKLMEEIGFKVTRVADFIPDEKELLIGEKL